MIHKKCIKKLFSAFKYKYVRLLKCFTTLVNKKSFEFYSFITYTEVSSSFTKKSF